MSLYGKKIDYNKIINSNIQKAKLLYSLSDKDRILVENLLNKKEKIIEENGFFANYKLKKINKKINQIKLKY